jgi:hypothetical protein
VRIKAAAGSPWLSLYGVGQPVPNLTRITVDGAENATNYLRVTVNRRGPQVLSWTKVPFAWKPNSVDCPGAMEPL